MTSLAEQIIAEEQAKRAAEAQQKQQPRRAPGAGGDARPRRGKAGKRRWPLREWVARGTMAKAGRAGQLYAVLICFANPKTRQYSGGRERLAEACGCSADHVSELLAKLDELGMIRRQQTKQTVNGSVTSGLFVWIVDPPAIEQPAGPEASLPGMGR